MRGRAVAALVALGALVAVALPGGAVAGSGYFKVPGQYSELIQTRTADGFRFLLEVSGRRATIDFDKRVGHGGFEYIAYSLHRRLAPGPDLHFRLGRHGRVDLRFVVGKRVVRKNTGCTGGPSVTEFGHFVGRLRIRGRRGVAAVDLQRTSGVVDQEPPLVCHRVKHEPGVTSVGIGTKGEPTVPKGELVLIAGGPGGLRFSASRFEEKVLPGSAPFSFADASISHREGDLIVTSIASAGRSPHTFVSPDPSDPLSAATIEPGAPFSGSATFAMTSPSQGEWSGDLAVELPGYGRVPLTGPKFAAGLCETEACTPTLPKALRPRTGPAGGEFTGSFFGE
jgi:hypothetical protein